MERPKSLDPADASPGSQASLITADLLFDGLTRMAPGKATAGPALSDQWTVSPDGRVWDFHIRPDATFSNGRKITSTDVKYSLERVAKRGSASLAGVRLEDIGGYRAFVDGKTPGFDGIRAGNPAVVEIAVDEPLRTLPELLASPLFGVVPKEAVEAPAPPFATKPVGSGPFAVASVAPALIRLQRAKGSKAALDGIDLSLYDDTATAYADFTRGKLDWTQVPASKLDEAIGKYGKGHITPFHAELFYGMNLKNPMFGDVRFRQAIVRAVDRQAIVAAVYRETASPLDGIVPAGVPGHQDDPCGTRCAHDPDAAKALVQQAFGAGKPPTVNVDFDEGASQEAVAGVIKRDLEAVGIPVALRPKPFDEYQKFAVGGEQQLFAFGWIGVYASPGAYLAPLFKSNGLDNVTGFSDAGIDAELAAARTEKDVTRRNALFAQAEQGILSLSPIIPIAQFKTEAVVAKRVKGLTMAVDGTFDAEAVTVR